MELFHSFYNDVKLPKTHNMQLCALDEGPSTRKCYANEAYWK